jgi:hypothetical protein
VRFNSAWGSEYGLGGFACLGDRFCAAALLYRPHRDGFWLESADSFGCLPVKSSFSGGIYGVPDFLFLYCFPFCGCDVKDVLVGHTLF